MQHLLHCIIADNNTFKYDNYKGIEMLLSEHLKENKSLIKKHAIRHLKKFKVK